MSFLFWTNPEVLGKCLVFILLSSFREKNARKHGCSPCFDGVKRDKYPLVL